MTSPLTPENGPTAIGLFYLAENLGHDRIATAK